LGNRKEKSVKIGLMHLGKRPSIENLKGKKPICIVHRELARGVETPISKTPNSGGSAIRGKKPKGGKKKVCSKRHVRGEGKDATKNFPTRP